MSRTRPWMPLYVGDFIADTMHLGATETGIYIRLLMHCWQHGTIPRDPRQLALIAHCDSRLWHQYEATVLQFFDAVDASTMHHKRVTTELLRSEEISNKRKASALQKHSKSSASVEQLQTHARASTLQSQSPSSLRSEGRSRASRLDADWKPSEEEVAYAKAQGLSESESLREAEKFRNYWLAKAGKDGAKLDWPATWRNWAMRAAETLGRSPMIERSTEANGRFYAANESPQWHAWDAYLKTQGKTAIRDRDGGWWFESEWPPRAEAAA